MDPLPDGPPRDATGTVRGSHRPRAQDSAGRPPAARRDVGGESRRLGASIALCSDGEHGSQPARSRGEQYVGPRATRAGGRPSPLLGQETWAERSTQRVEQQKNRLEDAGVCGRGRASSRTCQSALFDSDALGQILDNLLDNAEKHTRTVEHRRVSVIGRLQTPTISGSRWRTTDPGYPRSQRRNLSSARLIAPEDAVGRPGLGLGLAVARSLCSCSGRRARDSIQTTTDQAPGSCPHVAKGLMRGTGCSMLDARCSMNQKSTGPFLFLSWGGWAEILNSEFRIPKSCLGWADRVSSIENRTGGRIPPRGWVTARLLEASKSAQSITCVLG